jgi:hypothetical protein
MDTRPIDPRADLRPGVPNWGTDPIHDYRVTFWRKGASSELAVSGAVDVHEVLDWAEQEARARESSYTLFALVDRGSDRGLVWLAGIDPTVWSRPNFEREHPASSA